MVKAMKHYKAGLLHIEVLGYVPEPCQTPRQRRARGRPTSPAQQFYNLKQSWMELELICASNFGSRDFVLALTYDDAHLPANKKEASKCLQKFFRKLRDVRKKRGEILKYIYVTEGQHGKSTNSFLQGDSDLEDKRLHHHVILNNAGKDCLEEIKSLWQTFGGYVRAELLDVHYYRELAKYLTKEAREFGRPKPGERTWVGSRNLTKYEVEYIEIPTDSIILAPPHGAVDYTSFHERNPYGFGDSAGARYLLFPDVKRPLYSYAAGRGKNGPPI